MNKRLIINGDDFGYDADATTAILELLATRRISSTTILANLVKHDDIKNLKSIDHVSTGIHINLISGKPLSDPDIVQTLVCKSGDFYSARELVTRFLARKIHALEIVTEVSAQIKALRDMGVDVSHADSHQHLHQFPFLGPIILNALKGNNLSRIRNCSATSYPNHRIKIVRLFAELTKRHLTGFRAPEGLIAGLSASEEFNLDCLDKVLQRSFSERKTLEMMTHPGLKDREGSYMRRTKEYQLLKDGSITSILKKTTFS